MANRYTSKLSWADVTPEHMFLNRRAFMAGSAAFAAGSIAAPALAATSQYSTDAEPNTFEEITTYNNFYEFGTGKTDPSEYADALTTSPWAVEIGGMVDKPGSYGFEDIMSQMTIEERIYRFRCVEAWSMVIPFDEAMHPLTIMATGIYGKDIPNQNGAPLRLVVPWKYGFKSIKSIVKITLTDTQPEASWNMIQPSEYGFYSNVNPNVDHPRWSQASERQIGGGLLAKRVPTLMFNGYEEEVAGLYENMDLKANF